MTKTEIANLALSHARETLISGNVDTTEELIAETVLLHYEQTLRETLGRVRPSFAQTRALLTENATAPAFQYAKAFILPTDLVEIIDFNGDEIAATSDRYEIEGRDLLTNEDAAKIVYIRYEENTALYGAEFTEALALLLAHKVCNARRGDTSQAEGLMVYHKLKASEAGAKAAQGRKKSNSRDKVQRSSRWTGTTRSIGTNESTNGTEGVTYDA